MLFGLCLDHLKKIELLNRIYHKIKLHMSKEALDSLHLEMSASEVNEKLAALPLGFDTQGLKFRAISICNVTCCLLTYDYYPIV